MKAKLAGIASHTGMSKVFRLLGSDIYRVLTIECVFGESSAGPCTGRNLLPVLRQCAWDLGRCTDLAGLFDVALAHIQGLCGTQHAMLLMHDAHRACLYTVASRGYSASGVGSEIRVGEGIIGVAARERTPIRIGYAAQEYLYSRSVRERFACSDERNALETAIPFPGLADSASQLAVPIVRGETLEGVLYVESPHEMRFTWEDEDALMILSAHLGVGIHVLSDAENAEDGAVPPRNLATLHGAPVTVRHFAADHSVFVGNDYLIKGVAGAVLWKLLNAYVSERRCEFTNRELRLDPALRLPDLGDNLEARLILLQRRLAERCGILGMEKTGRGRFRIAVDGPLQLIEVPRPDN